MNKNIGVKDIKEKFESILNDHGIYGEDVEEILYAVYDMLNYAADKTREEEPYASKSIDKLEMAAYEVYNLINEVCIYCIPANKVDC